MEPHLFFYKKLRYLTENMLTGDFPSWMLKNKASNKVNMCVFSNLVLLYGLTIFIHTFLYRPINNFLKNEIIQNFVSSSQFIVP